MTKMLDLDAAERLCNAARDELSRVCKNNFTMRVHIPVRPEDSDEVIGAGLDVVPALIAELRAARAVVEAVEPLVNEWRDQPKFADRVFDLRNAVVKAYDAAVEGGGT